ncbi:MAG: nucleoid-structuring protein H-NS, partial [Mycobacterium sp.]
KAPAKKAPAKKAPAKKAPAKKAQSSPPIETNGQLATGAKTAAARAKSTVTAASNPAAGESAPWSDSRFPVPVAVAMAVCLLALLLVRQLRRRGS